MNNQWHPKKWGSYETSPRRRMHAMHIVTKEA
jgi:hypothetical protein